MTNGIDALGVSCGVSATIAAGALGWLLSQAITPLGQR